FEKNKHRHEGIKWQDVEEKLRDFPDKIWSLNEMEKTGGEPDVIGYEEDLRSFVFCDCSQESPKGRRSVCYEQEALEKRKKYKPENSALHMAEKMGLELLTEEQYKALQEIEKVDLKTSSWIKTPRRIRDLGGALFCDYRYETVFTYHNSAESYYGSRGFRGILYV